MKIEKAQRKKTPLLINLYGLSGSGKTYSALTLAKGIVDEGERVGLIDTENGRASHYANMFDFDIINLDPPFTPERFLEAIKTFKSNGYKTIIIDSFSHEWDGAGGCLEIADKETYTNGKKKDGLNKWLNVKTRHRSLMNYILHEKINIIFCTRAKEQLEQVYSSGKNEIISNGFFPIQEKNFPYEMLCSFYLVDATAQVKKSPLDLKLNFSCGQRYLNIEDGKKIKEWNNQGKDVDNLENLKKKGAYAASDLGMDGLVKWWESLNKEEKKKLSNFKEELKLQCELQDNDNKDDIPLSSILEEQQEVTNDK